MQELLPELVIIKFSVMYLLAFQNPQEGDNWEWGSFLCLYAQWHVDRQAFLINTLNSYLGMVFVQKSCNCLMGPTTGVIGGHMYSIDLFSWEMGALFRCGCENTKEQEVCGKLFSSWRAWGNFFLLLLRFFFLISVVIKFIVFLSQLCCALRQRPKEAYHGILVLLWLAVVFPLVLYELGQP